MLDWRQIGATGVGLGLGVVLTLAGVFGWNHRPHPGPGPGPAPLPATGEHVVVVVDDSAPSIPQALILDGPLSRSLKLAGKLCITSLTDPMTKAKGYDQLLTPAGGAPAVIVLDGNGGLATKPQRLPTDAKAWHDLLEASLVNLPPPLTQWPSPRAVDRGGPTVGGIDKGQPYVDEGGHKRFLTARTDARKLQALPRYGDHFPTFPEAEWYEVNRHNLFGDQSWIYDQNGHGSCVGNGWVGALRRVRVLAGMNDVNLSPAFLYAQINGGQDQGAVISDGIAALTKNGVCAFSTMGQDPIFWRSISAAAKEEASRFKLVDAYRCETWEETVSAILTGRFLPVYGYMVGNSFGRFDQYGVAGHDRGPGNHCNHAEGLKKLPDGRWVLDDVNSWNFKWGPFHNGHVYLDKQHLFGGGDMPDVCVIRVAGRDPKDPFEPPAYRPGK